MKKIIFFIAFGLLLSGCSLIRPHKNDIEQGNVFSQEEISKLHPGMSEAEVKEIMGNPVLMNIFTPNRIDYIYTFQTGYGKRIEKHVTCIFYRGQLKEIIRN